MSEAAEVRALRPLRAAASVVLALLLARVLDASLFFQRLPPLDAPWLSWSPAASWTTLAFALLLALLLVVGAARERPLPAWLGIIGAVVGFAAYAHANIDWSLLAADAGIAHGGVPGPGALVPLALPLAAAFVFHALEERHRLRERYGARGFDGQGVGAATRLVLPSAARAGALALALWALLVVAFSALGFARPLLAPLAATWPLAVPVAVGILLVAAFALARRR